MGEGPVEGQVREGLVRRGPEWEVRYGVSTGKTGVEESGVWSGAGGLVRRVLGGVQCGG